MRKICDGFHAQIVDNCPDTPDQRHALLDSAKHRLNDMSTVIYKTLEHRDRVLHAASLNLRSWEIQVTVVEFIISERFSGPEIESHFPHAEQVQLGHYSKVFDCRMLGTNR